MDNKTVTEGSSKAGAAIEKFNSGYNCSQSVFYAFCNDLSIDEDAALKMSCGFGAGMGRKQEVCGAVTGGILIIGAKYGRGKDDDYSATEKAYEKTRELINKFETKYGTIICLELLNGCDLMTERGRKYFSENNLKNKTCKECISTAVRILEEIV